MTERTRELRMIADKAEANGVMICALALRQSADEIDRLRAENARGQERIDSLEAANAALQRKLWRYKDLEQGP